MGYSWENEYIFIFLMPAQKTKLALLMNLCYNAAGIQKSLFRRLVGNNLW
jgi:hypothetical protein